MFWADRIAQELKNKAQLVDDGKTPSGLIHVGSLRGVITHDLIFKALLEAGNKACFTYIFDSLDPLDSLPVYLDQAKYKEYRGKPLFTIPSPDDKEQNFAHYYAQDFQNVFNKLGVNPDILWSHELYKTGELNKQIKLALDNHKKIQDIYEKVSGSQKRELGWLPFQPICESCGKIGTTLTQKWDGKEVEYSCKPDLVEWAQGCGYQGKVSPYDGGGKLPWKVEWPAKWAALGITVEGEGKDHRSAGGSREVADAISKEVFNYPPPYDVRYEFFLYGGRKMSTSKGVGASAREVVSVLPAAVLRFLMSRTRPIQTLDFDPTGETIPRLFDEYDRAARAYYGNGDPDLARTFELSQIHPQSSKQAPFTVRFSLLTQWLQMPNVDELKEAEKLKGVSLTEPEKGFIEERIKYAKIWLNRYASEEFKFSVSEKLPDSINELTEEQKSLLQKISQNLDRDWQPEDFQNQIYTWGKELNLNSSETFEAIYVSLLGKKHGPKAAWLILHLDKEFVKKRFGI